GFQKASVAIKLHQVENLELLFLEHVRVGCIENVICQLGLAVNVDRSGGFAAQEFTENLPGPVRELFFVMCRNMTEALTGLPE
ncbi:hypothetical protein ACXWSP_09320, partial [Streptococcus pyogenes]